MNNKVLLGALCMMFAPILCVEQDYQEQLEAAIVQTNVPKVERLLKRRNKISVKNFQNMLGWANDIIEERRMLEPTARETAFAVTSTMYGGIAGMLGLFYYNDLWNLRNSVQENFLLQERGVCAVLGAVGLSCGYGLYTWWSGPRKRLGKSYDILFAIEDAIDVIEKKKKARSMQAKIRQGAAKESK